MAAAAKVLAGKVTAVEDMFEAARKSFFSAGDASNSANLSQARETVFAKEIPSKPNASESAARPETPAAEVSMVPREEELKVLVHR